MDKTDPICGEIGTIRAHGYYFCSKECIKAYEEKYNITKEKDKEKDYNAVNVPTEMEAKLQEKHGINKENSYTPVTEAEKWYREKTFLVILGLIVIYIIHLILNYSGIKILNELVFSFYDYVKRIWLAILIGLILGGLIDYFIPKKYISKYFAQRKSRIIFISAGLGFLVSAFSHGILAISMELHRKGASTPAVIAFLLASPWANLPVTIFLFGFFGIKALFVIISAIIIAIVTGLIYQLLDKKGLIESNEKIVEINDNFSILKDIKKRWKEHRFSLVSVKNGVIGVLKGSWELSKIVLWGVLVGMFLASYARSYISKDFSINYLGPTIIGLIVTLILATIMEILSEGTAPLAFEIFKQTGAFGNSFIFLMTGVATDYTEIGLIWDNIGKKTAFWLPIITVPQILILGYLFNNFL